MCICVRVIDIYFCVSGLHLQLAVRAVTIYCLFIIILIQNVFNAQFTNDTGKEWESGGHFEMVHLRTIISALNVLQKCEGDFLPR